MDFTKWARIGMVVVASVAMAGCSNTVKNYVEDAGFIYTDPPSKNYAIGSIFFVQRSLSNTTSVFTTACFNKFAVRDIAAGSIREGSGASEYTATKKIEANATLSITAAAKQALLDSPNPSIKAGANLLISSDMKLSNIKYYEANLSYLARISVELGKDPDCAGDGVSDTQMAVLRRLGLKTYHTQMMLLADAVASNTFQAGLSADVTAPLDAVINASLVAKGTIESASSTRMQGLVLGIRAWDPECPGYRIDKVPRQLEPGQCN